MTDRRHVLQLGVLAAGATTLAAATPASAGGGVSRGPLVIGHRGACGYRPEHTLAAYELAARTGADYIEPDLVTTSDHVLIARHENEISGTTDVASRPEFASRRTTKTIDGRPVSGWFTEDFTLAELKTLRAVERIPELRQRNTLYNGLFEIPTFDEVLRLRERLTRELRREIGVYPETKHPTYFAQIGLALEAPLAAALRRHGLDRRNAPVFVQSFEAANLRELHDRHRMRVPLVFLASGSGRPFGDPTSYDDYVTPDGLRELARFCGGLGPVKDRIIGRRADGTLGEPTSLVADAHAAGLVVHPWTFRAENQFLPADMRSGTDPAAFGQALKEQMIYMGTGIDGLFTDHPDVTVVARRLARS